MKKTKEAEFIMVSLKNRIDMMEEDIKELTTRKESLVSFLMHLEKAYNDNDWGG